nr:unnamed protein product [Spirometra erinaceieuropaei]
MSAMLCGIPGTAGYLDNIILVGSSPAELQDRWCAVIERVQEYGFHLRADKYQCFVDSIKYLGFDLDITGRHPDPENIRAIQRMPAPMNVSQLRSFLGLIRYYSALLPSLHDVRATLSRLLQRDAAWCWSPECEKAFAQLNSMLSSDLLLTHYDPTLPIVVAADASNYGKGISVYSASRLQRWAAILLGNDLGIRYCRTTNFGRVDVLSRLISNQQEPEEDTVIITISIEDDVRCQLLDAIRGIPVTAANIRRAT